MFRDIFANKKRFTGFFSDSLKGFQLIWKSGRRLTVINFCLFFTEAVLPVLSLLVLKHLIDQILKTGISMEHSGLLLGMFAGLQFLHVLVSQISDYKLAEQQQIVSDQIAKRVLTKAIDLDLQYYENPSFYDELHMAQQQSLNKPAALIAASQGIVQNVTVIAIFSGFMFVAHWSVLLLIVALSIPLAISRLLHGYRQFQLDKQCMPAQRKAADLFTYLTTDVFAKEVRIFGFGRNFTAQFMHFRKFIFSKKKELHYHFLKQSLFIRSFEIVIVTIIYCILIASATTGKITVGGLVIYIQVFQRLQNAITSLFQSGISLFQNQLYLREILKYLYAPSLVKNTGHFGEAPLFARAIQVRNLGFVYPETRREVLSGIDMNIAAGKITAIVGENGSGKTTLVKLLCRLYEVEAGTIKIDDTDITEVSPEDIRKNVTVLFQDFGKYYMTVEDNIALGRNKKDRDALAAAADKAGIAEKINTFPAGFKTHLGRTYRNGEQLSGGEWQKIALARGFYKDSRVLILDEPTSSMDPIAEHEFFMHLKDVMKDKMVILITHRLYNLKLADYIYVMEEGRVAEHGSFQELVNRNGQFKNMYDKQSL